MPLLDYCRWVAETITSSDNQHSTLMINATTGKGKSWTAIAICERVAQIVAEIKGGKPEDYFTIDNVAIITKAEALRILETKLDTKYACIIFDDIGVGWNSRDFMDQYNQVMNDIFQTFRTKNGFVCLTLPSPDLIDKVPRELVKMMMEIENSHFEYGFTECKLKHPTRIFHKANQSRYPYLRDRDNHRIVRHIVWRPSPHLTEEYEKRRGQIEKENTNTSIEKLKFLAESEKEEFVPKAVKMQMKEEERLKRRQEKEEERLKRKTDRDQERERRNLEKMEPKKKLLSALMKSDHKNGMSFKKIAEKYGVSHGTVNDAIHYNEAGGKI